MASPPLLSAKDLAKRFGISPLFEEISVSINPNEKLALIGPNGSGKSTLLRIFARLEHPDSGTLTSQRDLLSSYVAQEDRFEPDQSVVQVLNAACLEIGIDEYEIEGRVAMALGRAGFKNHNALVSTLSGGWKKRLAIVRGLIIEPELLLLDEPTNHLDIDGVLWLEDLLNQISCAVIFVSHDRYFIERLAQRVIEINQRYPKGYFSANGDYADFLEARALFLSSIQQAHNSLANKVRREVAWLRQGAKARTTKSKHRSSEAYKMIEELQAFKLEQLRSKLEFATSNRQTRELIKLDAISKTIAGRVLFNKISMTLAPGVRLGVVGPNGSGKTTFVRTLLGELKPDQGQVIRAPNLRVTFFDQARRNLDRSLTLKRALAPNGSDSVIFNDKALHIVSWAKRFLFTTEQLSLPVASLSGGEQARVLLAQIMLEQSDILFFDEPTNDLDIDTLEVLEESFREFPGAIVIVTHDRYFLDQIATIILGLEENAGALYADYPQWEESYQNSIQTPTKSISTKTIKQGIELKEQKLQNQIKKNILSQDELKELRSIEKKIEKAELELSSLNEKMNSANLVSDSIKLTEYCEKIAAQQSLVESLYSRWEELEQKK